MKRLIFLSAVLSIYTYTNAQTFNETMPKFLDGDLNTFAKYITERVEIPESWITNAPRNTLKSGVLFKVTATFTVMPDSTVDKISVHSGFDSKFNDEVASLIKTTNKLWTPSIQDGVYVPVSFPTFPLKIPYPDEYRTEKHITY